MDEKAREQVNQRALEGDTFTYASIRPVVVDLKLNLKCLNKKDQKKPLHYFTECGWLCNYLLAMSDDEFRSFDTHTRDIWSYEKNRNKAERHIEMPVKFIQAVYLSLK